MLASFWQVIGGVLVFVFLAILLIVFEWAVFLMSSRIVDRQEEQGNFDSTEDWTDSDMGREWEDLYY